MTSWSHARCFNLPRKMDSNTFLNSLDMSELSQVQKDEVERMISDLLPGGKRKSDVIDSSGKRVKVI